MVCKRGLNVKPALKGTLTATGLRIGESYVIYRRWDNVTYDVRPPLHEKVCFEATSDTYVYADDQNFQSDSAAYYRVKGHVVCRKP